jgi:hypothetical protein
MTCGKIVFCLSMIAVAVPLQAFGADAIDPNGGATTGSPSPPAAATNGAPPEKVAPNQASAPGVMAPKPTPSADAIKPNDSALSGRDDANQKPVR